MAALWQPDRPAGRPALTARRGGSDPRDGGVEAASTRRGGGDGRRGGGIEAAGVEEARRGGRRRREWEWRRRTGVRRRGVVEAAGEVNVTP